MNGAFVYALGFDGLKESEAVAADAVSSALPSAGGTFVSVLICISALGALNGLIFAGARISFAVGRDHRFFSWLGKWEAKKSTPTRALVAQGLIAIVLIAVLGSFLDTLLYTAAPVYLFFLATNVAVFVLRRKDPNISRPFRIPFYPMPPLLFGGACGFLIFSAVAYRPWIAFVALGVILIGLPVFWMQERRSRG